MLAFLEKRRPQYPGKSLSEQSRQPTKHSIHMEPNPGQIVRWRRKRHLKGEFALLFVPFSYITLESNNNDMDCGNKYELHFTKE